VARAADSKRVTAYLSLRPAPRSDVLEGAPEGWELQDLDPFGDADALTWLGFEHGEPDEPLLPWRRPERWPDRRPRTGGRHRASAWFRTAWSGTA
jgi:hypothetical protein